MPITAEVYIKISLAMLYVDLGRNHEALKDFDKAIELKA